MFLAPAFLFGLLAIGIPLWLHRVARANPTHYPFASLMLLEASETQRTAKRTLRYWLLLATRILLLIALVLAFAGPLISRTLGSATAADAKLHAILIDTSLSMRHGERWQRAVEEAQSVLKNLRASDRVMLATASGRRVDVVHGAVPAGNAGALRATLQRLQPGIERLDYGLAISTADNWLGSPRPAVVLHVISDLQQSAAPLRFADLEPPPHTHLALHNVGADAAENTYIESAAIAVLDTRSLEVGIRTSAAKPQRREVVLSVDGKEHARRSVEIPAAAVRSPDLAGEGGGREHGGDTAIRPADQAPAGGTIKVVFPELTFAAGAHRLEVALEPADALPQDDRFYAVVEHADPKALLIAHDQNADDAAYFGAAIGSLTTPHMTVEQRTVDAVTSGSLSNYSVVVVTDVGALPGALAERIQSYVAAGGSVLATLGPGAESATPLLSGWRIGEPRQRSAHVGAIANTHPVLREASDWHRVRFFRQRSVQIGENDKVLIAQEDGAPVLVERTIGAGRMLVLTAPVAREWNDLAIHPLFVRFIAEAARYLVGGDASAASSTVGAVVTTGLTAAGGGQIFDPKGERVLGLAQTAGADRLIPDQTGFYEIRGGEGARWLAVNVDARESDLTRLPASFVQRWEAMRVREPAAAGSAPDEPTSLTRSLGPGLLWLAAILLLAELLLANRYLAVRREVPK